MTGDILIVIPPPVTSEKRGSFTSISRLGMTVGGVY